MGKKADKVKTETVAERPRRPIIFRKPVLLACLRAYIPLALIVSLISIPVYVIQADKFSEGLCAKETGILQLQRSAFDAALAEHIKNALFLAELIRIKKGQLTQATTLNQLGNSFVRMIGINRDYDQIRWIDKRGMERIRIDQTENGAKVVSPDQLQDKSGRYYVREGLAGIRVYISKFDLNVEHGKIQLPVKPMLRVTATVQDEGDRAGGLVVLNIKGRRVIDQLRSIGDQMTGSLGLLNSAGYWLISPDSEDEWAFMYPDRLGRTFAAAYPNLWAGIRDADSGQFTTPDWLVTYITLDMASLPVSLLGYTFHAAESWKIVSLAPSGHLVPQWRWPYLCGVFTILLLMAGACFYWATAGINRSEARKTIMESEEKFRMVTRTMGEAVLMIDTKGRIRLWSDSAQRMLGYSSREALGRFLHEILVQDPYLANVIKEMESFYKKSFRVRKIRPREVNAVKKDGTHLPVEISVTPLIQDGKQVAIGVLRDLSERKMAEAEKNDLLALSTTDGLTGLANRRCFDEVLHEEYIRHSRSGGCLSLIFMDIDHFKAFNDTYGHIKGDQCLKRVARVLGRCAHRRSDLAARYGGEEFACILPETGSRGAVAIAKKIRKSIAALAIPHEKSGVARYLTVSLGVVTVSCTVDQAPEFILSQADEQLYKAKASGRNRIESIDLSHARQETDRNIVQLVWKESFYCGHDLIDSQHKGLFERSNRMFDAITSNCPVSEVSGLFSDLLAALFLHFDDEEKVMREIGYTGVSKHAGEHERLRAKAAVLSKSLENPVPHLGDTFCFSSKRSLCCI